MPTEEYKKARQKLWNALGFEPKKGSEEGDLYKVPQVTFKDGTPPRDLLKKMLGTAPTADKETKVLNAILSVLNLLTELEQDFKFGKIEKALRGVKNANDFQGQVCDNNTDRKNFKSLLTDYLTIATKKKFNAENAPLCKGDCILCSLLFLHYMTKDKQKLDVEIVYYPDDLLKNKDLFISSAQHLFNLRSFTGLTGVKTYFNQFSGKKLAYYDVVLPKDWDEKPTSDFDSINKRKNDFEQLSIQYYDIVSGVNRVSTSENRLQITKFFAAAHFKGDHYMVFADRKEDNDILAEITDALFPRTWAAAPLESAKKITYVTTERKNELADSINELKNFLVFDGVDTMCTLQGDIYFSDHKELNDASGHGDRTWSEYLQDCETVIDQVKMLKSLSPDKLTTFLEANEKDAKKMSEGIPLKREQVKELKRLTREANEAKIVEFANSTDGERKLTDSITSMEQQIDKLGNSFDFMNNAAKFYRMVNAKYDYCCQFLNAKLNAQLTGQPLNYYPTPDEQNLWIFFQHSGCTTVYQFMNCLGYYSNTRNPDNTIVFHNQKAQAEYNNTKMQGTKLEEQSKRLQSQRASLQDLQAAINNNSDYESVVLPQFKKCIFAFYDFSGDHTERRKQSDVLRELMYDKNTGKLNQMMKDLAKGAKKVKTVTTSELRRKAATATPTKIDKTVTKGSLYYDYISDIVVNDPKLSMKGEQFTPGNETLKRCTDALGAKGLNPNDVLHILGTASQTNGCESQDTNHATLDKQVTDRTQGPTQNIESLPGTIKREEMYETGELKDCDTAKPLIEKLADMKVIECVAETSSSKDIGRWVPLDYYYNGNVTLGGQKKLEIYSSQFPNGKFAFYSNGYIQPAVLNAQGEFALMEAMASAPCSYMSQDNKSNDGSQQFTQNFAAAFSYQNATYNNGQKVSAKFTPPQIMMNLMWVYPQYDNVLKDAIRQSAKHPEKKLVIVHMPDIGQGAFGNPKGLTGLAMIYAIIANIDKLAGSNIIFQREARDGLNPAPARELYRTLTGDWGLFTTYANKLDKNLYGAIDTLSKNERWFDTLIDKRAIAFGYLDTNGNYVIPAPPAPQGQQNPQYPQYQPPNPQMQNPMQYRNY